MSSICENCKHYKRHICNINPLRTTVDKSECPDFLKRLGYVTLEFEDCEKDFLVGFANGFLDPEHLAKPTLSPHITVFFGFTQSSVGELANVLQGVRPFLVNIEETAVFGNSEWKTRPVVLKVESTKVRELNRAYSTLPNAATYPDFRPHVTLGYVHSSVAEIYTGDSRCVGRQLTVRYATIHDHNGGTLTVRL